MRTPEAGKENMYRVSAAGGQPTLVIGPEAGGYTNLGERAEVVKAGAHCDLRQLGEPAGSRAGSTPPRASMPT